MLMKFDAKGQFQQCSTSSFLGAFWVPKTQNRLKTCLLPFWDLRT